jgi:hypothetical protein
MMRVEIENNIQLKKYKIKQITIKKIKTKFDIRTKW